MKKNTQSRGFIQIVILAIVIIAALAYFNIDIRTIIESPFVQKMWNIFLTIWNLYLQPIFAFAWTMFTTGLSNLKG